MYKLIIAGSRGVTDYEVLKQAMVDSSFWKRRKELEIVSGGARGVDKMGELFAQRNNVPVVQFIPDWDGLGKRAGMVRNIEMADYADALLALWDGESRGTKQMIDEAKKRGLDVYVCITKPEEGTLIKYVSPPKFAKREE